MIPWIRPGSNAPFPPVADALSEPNGLLAAGADLSPGRLLEAYRHGIFPWYAEGEPILWWSPDPRLVIYPDQVHVARRLARRIRAGGFRLTLDAAFEEVIEACSAPRERQRGTWITPEMNAAYRVLHRMGHAHSLEVWQGERLTGGIYGVALGRAFFGESMFHRADDASKIALVALCAILDHHRFGVLDCQLESAHLRRLGGVALERRRFVALVAGLTASEHLVGDWHSLPVPIQWAPFFPAD